MSGLPALPAVRPAPPEGDWRRLRACESSGRYDAVSKTGAHRGAYQFGLPTWRALWQRLGRDDLAALDPAKAAPPIQDYAAALLYQQRGWQPWTCARIVGLS